MAQAAKFHEKAVVLFGETQAVLNTPETLVGADAMAALELSYSRTIVTEAYEYTGDDLSRDEETVITDQTAEITYQGFAPVCSAAGTEPPMAKFFGACGGATVVVASTSVAITNAVASNDLMTQQFRRSSPDISTQKSYELYNAVGSVDLTIEVGQRSMFDFTFMGNVNDSTAETALVPDYTTQKTLVGPVLKAVNLGDSELVLGSNQAATGISNVCFQKLSAPNWLGFDYERFLTGCEEGYAKGATPSDVTITMLEDDVIGGNFNPEPNLGNVYTFYVDYGEVAGTGKHLTFKFTDLQLVNVTTSAVSKYVGQDLAFRNRGTVELLWT